MYDYFHVNFLVRLQIAPEPKMKKRGQTTIQCHQRLFNATIRALFNFCGTISVATHLRLQ